MSFNEFLINKRNIICFIFWENETWFFCTRVSILGVRVWFSLRLLPDADLSVTVHACTHVRDAPSLLLRVRVKAWKSQQRPVICCSDRLRSRINTGIIQIEVKYFYAARTDRWEIRSHFPRVNVSGAARARLPDRGRTILFANSGKDISDDFLRFSNYHRFLCSGGLLFPRSSAFTFLQCFR